MLHIGLLVDHVGNRLAVEDRTSLPAAVDRSRKMRRRTRGSGREMDSPAAHSPAGHSPENDRTADLVADRRELKRCSWEGIGCTGPT